ncbi:MAG: hypothetical protein IKQ35_03680 [Bacilli bacterium]|nr:hypothetical protein [Bacilli bacterium]
MNKNVKLFAIIILNILSILIGLVVKIYLVVTIANIVLSIYYLNTEDRTIISDRKFLILVGLINIFCLKWVTALLDFLLYDEASTMALMDKNKDKSLEEEELELIKKEKIKPKVDPRVRKIDLTIKLGVFMVLVAGFIFATTGWESLNIIIKGLIFIAISVFFIVLSKFAEKNIKIKSTIYLYWFLGMAFITFTYIAAGLNNIFGTYFSLKGAGNYLYMSSIFGVVALLAYISYKNFKAISNLYILYFSIVLSITELIVYFNLLLESGLAIILGLFTLLELFKYKEGSDLVTLKDFSEAGAIITIGIFALFSRTYTDILSTILLSLLALINIYLLSMKHQDKTISNYVSIGYFLALIPSFSLVENQKTFVILLLVFVVINYILSLTYKNESSKNVSLVVSDVLLCMTFFVSYPEGYLMSALVTAVALYITGMTFTKEGRNEIEFQFIPAKLLLIIISLLLLVEKYIFDVNVIGTALTLTFLIIAFVYFVTTNETTKKVFKFYSGILPVVSLVYLLSYELIDDTSLIAISLASFVAMLILYFGSNMYTKDETPSFKEYTFILLLVYLYVIPKIYGYMYLPTDYVLYSGIISMFFYIGLALLNINDEYNYNISLLAVGVPFFTILNGTTLDPVVSLVLFSLLLYYLTFTIAHMCSSDFAKNFVGYIGYSISFLMVLFESNPYVILYTIVLASASIIMGFMNKRSDCKFFIGLGAIIVEIIVGFGDLWRVIPIWAYILVFGILLIVIATYAQLKDVKNKETDDKKE